MDKRVIDYFSRLTDEERGILEKKQLDAAMYFSAGGFLVDKDRLLAEGQHIAIRQHPRFVFFPEHSHNYVEIVYMLSGATTHTINGAAEIALGAGELLMLNQHVAHSICPAEKDDVAINFLVLPSFFDTALEMIGPNNPLNSFLLGGLQKDGGEITYLQFKTADIPAVQNLIENLLLGFLSPGPNEAVIARNTMGLLFLHLLHHTEVMQTDVVAQKQNALVVECLQEIEAGYISASLSGVAQKYGVSSAYLSHLVKSTTGRNFKALLQEKRLSTAEMLLRHTELNVNEVIAAVGYQNTSHFYRLFKQRTGAAPGEWRQ